MAIIRQRQLLEGLIMLLDRQKSEDINTNEKTLAALIWAAACAIWSNLGEESMRYETIAIVLDVGPRALE